MIYVIQRNAIIVEYFCSQVVFTEKFAYLLKYELFSAAACRGCFKVGWGQNNMKHIGARHDQKSTSESILLPLQNIFFYILTFSSCLAPIFFILFCPPPTLKYPLHAPAEKRAHFLRPAKKSIRL